MFHKVDVDVLICLVKPDDFMHGGVDDFTKIALHGNKGTVTVGEYRDEVMTTSKPCELREIMFEECLCLMRCDIRVEVERGKHADK